LISQAEAAYPRLRAVISVASSLQAAHLAALRLVPVNVQKGCSALSEPQKGFYYR